MSARIFVALLAVCCTVSAQSEVENKAKEFLRVFDEEATKLVYQHSLASWTYNTNITNENAEKLVNILRIFNSVDWPVLTKTDVVWVTDFHNLMCLFSFYPVTRGANLERLLHQYVKKVPGLPHQWDQRSTNQITAHLPTRQRLWCPIPRSSCTCKPPC